MRGQMWKFLNKGKEEVGKRDLGKKLAGDLI
jgi:hypothetical protein